MIHNAATAPTKPLGAAANTRKGLMAIVNQQVTERMVSAEGIESARKRKFNDMQGHGWHLRP